MRSFIAPKWPRRLQRGYGKTVGQNGHADFSKATEIRLAKMGEPKLPKPEVGEFAGALQAARFTKTAWASQYYGPCRVPPSSFLFGHFWLCLFRISVLEKAAMRLCQQRRSLVWDTAPAPRLRLVASSPPPSVRPRTSKRNLVIVVIVVAAQSFL